MKTWNACCRVGLATVVILCITVASSVAEGARILSATISLEGKTLLEAMTSDDGRVDADGVWEYLKTMKFKPTQHFIDLQVPQVATEKKLVSEVRPGQMGKLLVNITYGGMALPRELTIKRVARDKQGREWTLDPSEIDRMFDRRYIRRLQVPRLANPRKSKR